MDITAQCYQHLFKVSPEKTALDIARHADTKLCELYSPHQMDSLQKALQSNLNLEYLEYLSRRKNLNNPLTTAFKIATSLGESSPANFNRFTNTQENRFAVCTTLLKAVWHTMLCFLISPAYTKAAKEIANA